MNSPPGTYVDKLMSEQWKNIAIVSNDDNRLKKMLGATVHSFNMSLKETAKRSGSHISDEQAKKGFEEKGNDQP